MGLQPGINLQHKDGMDDPLRYYSPAIGPSGIVFNSGDHILDDRTVCSSPP